MNRIIALREKINRLFLTGNCAKIEELLLKNAEMVKHDRELLRMYYLVPVCTAEREEGRQTLFEKVSSIEELMERNTRLKFYLRRIAFDLLEDEEIFYRFCLTNRISLQELFIVTYVCTAHKEKVKEFINEKIVGGKIPI